MRFSVEMATVMFFFSSLELLPISIFCLLTLFRVRSILQVLPPSIWDTLILVFIFSLLLLHHIKVAFFFKSHTYCLKFAIFIGERGSISRNWRSISARERLLFYCMGIDMVFAGVGKWPHPENLKNLNNIYL